MRLVSKAFKAMAMPAEQLKQIKTQQRKTQASSQKKSGGSAEGHDHHHEEEGPGPAPGDPGDHYSSGIGG